MIKQLLEAHIKKLNGRLTTLVLDLEGAKVRVKDLESEVSARKADLRECTRELALYD